MKRRGVPRLGRPPAGFDGEPSSRYPQLAVRVPPAMLDRVRALATEEGRAIWRVLADAIEVYDRSRKAGQDALPPPKEAISPVQRNHAIETLQDRVHDVYRQLDIQLKRIAQMQQHLDELSSLVRANGIKSAGDLRRDSAIELTRTG